MKEKLNQTLKLRSKNTMSDEEKIELINLKYEKDIQKKIDNLIVLYRLIDKFCWWIKFNTKLSL